MIMKLMIGAVVLALVQFGVVVWMMSRRREPEVQAPESKTIR